MAGEPNGPPASESETPTEPDSDLTRPTRGNPLARLLVQLVAVVIVVATVGGGAALFVFDRFNRAGSSSAEIVLVVPRGAATVGIGRLLEDRGVVDDGQLFSLGVRLFASGSPLRAGEFAFPAGVSPRGAAEILQFGETVVRRLTVPEGLTVFEVLNLVGAAEGLTGGLESTIEEGMLLPETYHYSRGDGRADLVARMGDAMDAVLAELWDTRATDLPLDTPEEALILASIVEKETAVAGERAQVAGVFVNRLRRGMRLQSDPTVVYGLTNGNGPLGRPLTRSDLATVHPYNTYVIDRLPPAPIANPGRASIEAVLNPAATDALYFVADGSGGHAFAETLEEHNRNVARWRRVQRERAREGGSN